MTSHVGRLYAHRDRPLRLLPELGRSRGAPLGDGGGAQSDPRLAALAAREQRLRHESVAVQRLVRHRWAVYRAQLRTRQSQIAAAKRARRSRQPPPRRSGS